MIYAKECLCDVIAEAGPLLKLNHAEMNVPALKLDPRWDALTDMEHAGALAIFTARKEGSLVGYSAYFLTEHLDHRGLHVAHNTVLFIHPDHRQGMTAAKLITFAERELKLMGMNVITLRSKFKKDIRPLFHRLGYEDEEMVVMKFI